MLTTRWCPPLFLLVVLIIGTPAAVAAQDRLGGHFGFVIPLVTRANDTTTTVSDDFVIGWIGRRGVLRHS